MHEKTPTADDLPRDPGTLYAVRNLATGRYIKLRGYDEAYVRWHAGAVIHTKDGNGTRADRDARDWEPVDPPA